MSTAADPGPGEIQLHFCQRCGISIPVFDVETGRAKAAPGGYLCTACVYQQEREDESVAPLPGVVEERPATGLRVLLVVLLLYLSGTTSYLLYREVTRKPPHLELPKTDNATSAQVTSVSGRVEQLQRSLSDMMASVGENEKTLTQGILALKGRLDSAEQDTRTFAQSARHANQDLLENLLSLTKQTVGLRKDIPAILEELKGLRDDLSTGKGAEPTKTTEQPTPKEAPAKPAKTKEQADLELQAREFVKTLENRRAKDQDRYNAAVQLGDLGHQHTDIVAPIALDPLQNALTRDRNNLVQRAAAWSLGQLGKAAVTSIPALIDQLDNHEAYVGYQCERALGDITQSALGAAVSFHFDPTMNLAQRRQIKKQWENWWGKVKAEVLPPG